MVLISIRLVECKFFNSMNIFFNISDGNNSLLSCYSIQLESFEIKEKSDYYKYDFNLKNEMKRVFEKNHKVEMKREKLREKLFKNEQF